MDFLMTMVSPYVYTRFILVENQNANISCANVRNENISRGKW